MYLHKKSLDTFFIQLPEILIWFVQKVDLFFDHTELCILIVKELENLSAFYHRRLKNTKY